MVATPCWRGQHGAGCCTGSGPKLCNQFMQQLSSVTHRLCEWSLWQQGQRGEEELREIEILPSCTGCWCRVLQTERFSTRDHVSLLEFPVSWMPDETVPREAVWIFSWLSSSTFCCSFPTLLSGPANTHHSQSVMLDLDCVLLSWWWGVHPFGSPSGYEGGT